jgi:3D (Asp-Asp-Asp) domain-containing protein
MGDTLFLFVCSQEGKYLMRRERSFSLAAVGMLVLAALASGQVDAPVGDGSGAAASVAGAPTESKSGPEFRVETTPIPFKVEYEFSRTVGPGRLVSVRQGKPGRLEKIYEIHYKNGKPVGKTLIKSNRVEPVSKLVHMGRKGYTSSRHKFTRTKVLTMEATAYDPSAGRGRHATFRTATGLRAQYGIVAVDPKVIPLGTRVFVEGYGFAIAADKGSAIKGKKIDLCYNTRSECIRFGRRDVRVHILR